MPDILEKVSKDDKFFLGMNRRTRKGGYFILPGSIQTFGTNEFTIPSRSLVGFRVFELLSSVSKDIFVVDRAAYQVSRYL